MAKKIWTAEDLEKLSAAEQDEIFQASIVRDLDEVPPGFLAKIRTRMQARIDATESPSR